MRIEVSNGEIIDKYSILEIKLKKITNETKRKEIQKEMNELSLEEYKRNESFAYYYKLLLYVNEKIWDLTDLIKYPDTSFGEYSVFTESQRDSTVESPLEDSFTKDTVKDVLYFVSQTIDIFELNKKRFRIKNIMNLLTQSELKEQKSYSGNGCKIIIDNEEMIYDKISEINYLIIEYDFVVFITPYIETIKQLFKSPTIIYNNTVNINTEINITTYQLPKVKEYWHYIPENYVSSVRWCKILETRKNDY